MKLDPFYLIVDSADWIERLVPLGVKLVQLRIKDMNGPDLHLEIRRARAVCRAHRCQLIVNDHWEIALQEGCDFVHLGQEDLARADRAAIRAGGLRLGLSTHDQTELDTALASEPDYIALGPIWPTVLKQMPWAPQGLERIGHWKRIVGSLPLIAIGGLTAERIDSVFSNGADSVAVVTDVIRNIDPERRTREWLERTKAWR